MYDSNEASVENLLRRLREAEETIKGLRQTSLFITIHNGQLDIRKAFLSYESVFKDAM